MYARQSEMDAAIAIGHTSEVCRSAALVAQGPKTLESWSYNLSNVSNMVHDVGAQVDIGSGFWSIVPLQGRTICVELLNLLQWSIFAGPMMDGCGGVCVLSRCPPNNQRKWFRHFAFGFGGVGLRSASRVSEPAYWASWADSLFVIRRRHLEVARQLVQEFEIPNRHSEQQQMPRGISLG